MKKIGKKMRLPSVEKSELQLPQGFLVVALGRALIRVWWTAVVVYTEGSMRKNKLKF